MKKNIENCTCRVCGFIEVGELWEDGICPSYGICSSCGCEAGNEDFLPEERREYRQKWIDNGMKWWMEPHGEKPPKNWDPLEQMKNIPPEWR